ncbi:MAG: ATP-binding cassette domain-containing protein [Promethearchaeota archaeon]
MNQNIIEVQNITKTYEQGNDLAVNDGNFNIKKGEIFALLSSNGTGKTTTISILVDWYSII